MEAGSHTTAPYHAVVGGEEEPTYRTVSVLALVALILGLLSPLVFAAPLLLVFPLMGIGVALVALRQIAANDTAMVGRGMALVGLALSVACLGAIFTRSAVGSRILSNQAREMGAEWFSRLQAGDVEGAFKMTQDSMRVAPPPRSDEPGDGPVASEFDQFRAQPVVEYILSHGDHATVTYDADVVPGDGPLTAYRIVQQYLITDPHHDGQPIPVRVTLQRSKLDGQMRWIVMNYMSDELQPADDHSGHAHPHVH